MKKVDKKNKYSFTLSVLMIILIILILLTSIILTSRTQDYSADDITTIFLVDTNFNYSVYDSDQSWTIKESIDLFDKVYNEVDGEHLVESGNNDNVIAPNTSYDYDFDIKNTGNVPLNYSLNISPSLYIGGKLQDIDDFPIDVRLKNGSEEYFYGTSSQYKPISGLGKFETKGSLNKNNTAKYIIEWVWNDENDSLDTSLGTTSAGEEIVLKVDIKVIAELAEKDLSAIPVFSTTQQDIGGAIKLWPFLLIILLILIILIAMTYIYLKLRKTEQEDEK